MGPDEPLYSSPAPSGAPAFSSAANPNAQHAGLEALQALAVTAPMRRASFPGQNGNGHTHYSENDINFFHPLNNRGNDVRGSSYGSRYPRSDVLGTGDHGIPAFAYAVHGPRSPSLVEPTVSVLIPAHNEEETIGTTVRACAEQDYPVSEIIVVADSCTDQTAVAAIAAGATKVIETSFGDKAANQNAALSDIRTDVVVGFDGDTIPRPGCIALMIDDIKAGFDATCSTILPLQSRGFFVRGRRFAYALGRRWWRLCQAKVGRMQVLTGASYAFKTEAIKAIGGFPNGLISADMDATWALHRAHYKCGYAAKAVALTVEPETFRVYKAQMRRWSSGYFQNVARYKRELLNWRSALVIWTALFDLICMFAYEIILISALATGHDWMLRTFAIGMAIHAAATISLVSTVVGFREAVLGYVPYLILNIYNKWLYMCAFGREWILGRHYAAWTGRQGRKTVITPMTRARKITLSVMALLLALTGYTVVALRHRASVPSQITVAESKIPVRYLGIVTPAPTIKDLDAFARITGVHPNLDEYYVPWGRRFSRRTVEDIASANALPMISWEPFSRSTTLRAIAEGKQDHYINSWAHAIAAYHLPIAISFAAEMNGYWENWGPKYATAAQFIAAWRRIHDLFGAAGATNVIWVWTPVIVNGVHVPLRPYWPGGTYVNWIGLDGYWWGPHSSSGLTFSAIFYPTLTQVRQFTNRPVIIAETAGAPGYKVIAVHDLFSGVEHTPGLLGFVWFNINAPVDDWRLQDSPAAVTAYRSAAEDSR